MAMAKAAARTESLYGVSPGVMMFQKWAAGLKEKTGRTLDEWVALVKKEAPKEEKARAEWLRKKHQFNRFHSEWIAERAGGKGGDHDSAEVYLKAAVGYVEEQYSGAKESLRPIYDALLALGRAVGADVKACPCRTIVPLYRQHVFAQIKATTNTRVDLGLCLTDYKGKLPKRIVDTGGAAKKDRITHRIEIKDVSEINSEVKSWLKTAYELDA
jgi:Domain of unknown function (DUF5655)/Domain of unknown function (DUF4287)